MRRIWQRFCDEFTEKPRAKTGGNPSKLSDDDLQLIEVLKNQKGSTSLKDIYLVLEEIGDCQGDTSIPAISRAIKEKMLSGNKYSRKKITTIAKERFTPLNMIYTQLFIDYLNSKDPYKVKFLSTNQGLKHLTLVHVCMDMLQLARSVLRVYANENHHI